MTPESRYSSSNQIFVPSHTYTEFGELDVDEKSGSDMVMSRMAIYRLTTLPLPQPPKNSTRAKVTSYMHLYAEDHYGDSQKWWIVADANPHIRYPLDLKTNDLVFLP